MSTMPCLPAEVILGVDTHRDVHAAALVDELGRLVASQTFPTTRRGIRALIGWAQTTAASAARVSRAPAAMAPE